MIDNSITHRWLYIAGERRRPHTRETVTVVSANTEQVIGSVPDADIADVDAAVAAARAAFDDPTGWRHWTAAERAAALHAFADAIDARSTTLATLVSDQNGMPITLASLSEARRPGQVLRYYADIAVGQQTQETRASSTGGTTFIEQVPVGVVGAIAPWNFPNTLAVMKYAPALAAGCTVVLKPAPETVLDAALIVDAAIEAGLPPGVLNIVTGGPQTGAYLVDHPGVDAVAFTGSTPVGREIGAACGRLLRPVTLELGGKSAAVILDDADLGSVTPQLTNALFGNNGQTCFGTSRVLTPVSRYEETIDFLAELARTLTVGNSLDPATRIGPLVSRRQRARVEGYLSQGRHDARLITGGGRPASQRTGWFIEPTVYADVRPDSALFREEIFGPVVTVTPYVDDADALRLANDSDYGLGGTVWTTDHPRGLQIAQAIHSGSVGINGYIPDINSPMPAVKASGLGFKLGPEALTFYRRYHSIYL